MSCFRRIVAGVTLSMVLITSIQVPVTTHAAVSSTIDSYKYSITSRLLELEEFLGEETSGQYGLLYEVRLLSEYSMYVKHITSYTDYGFSPTEVTYYQKKLENSIKAFNTKYGKSSNNIVGLTLKYSASEGTPVSNIQSNLLIVVPNYVEKLLDGVQTVYDNSKSDELKAYVLENNAVLLSNLYQVLRLYQDVPVTIASITSEDASGKQPIFSIDGTKNNSDIAGTIAEMATKYKVLLTYGRNSEGDSIGESTLEVDPEADFLEIFSDAVNTSSGVEIPTSPKLRLPYLAMFACGAVYEPMKSYAGSPEYTNALKTLAIDESNARDLVDVYNGVKDLRKPLYKRSIDSNGNPTGVAEMITIKDFFADIESGTAASLCTITGNFHYNDTAAGWIYSDTPLLSVESVGSSVAQEDEDVDIPEVADSGDAVIGGNSVGENIGDSTEEDTDLDVTEKAKVRSTLGKIIKKGTDVQATSATAKQLIVKSSWYRNTFGKSITKAKAIIKSIFGDSSADSSKSNTGAPLAYADTISETVSVTPPVFTLEPTSAPVVTPAPTETPVTDTAEVNTADNLVTPAPAISSDASETVDTSTNELMTTTLKNTIFMGDVRTENLRDTWVKISGMSKDELETRNKVYFVSDVVGDYNWFANTAGPKVHDIITSNGNTKFKIVFNLGLADTNEAAEDSNKTNKAVEYSALLSKSVAADLAGQDVIFQTVGIMGAPAAVDKTSKANAAILAFNATMKENLDPAIEFVDATTNMLNSNKDGFAAGYASVNGIVYDESTALKVAKFVIDIIYSDQVVSVDGTQAGDSTSVDTTAVAMAAINSAEELSTAVYATETVTDESRMSDPLYMYGSRYARAVDNTTTMIMQNILKSTVDLDAIKSQSTRYLYVNAFGDIVTDDNLVVFPGTANPMFTKESSLYNPYTAAFMNSYPGVISKSVQFQVSSEKDVGKYVFMADTKTSDLSKAPCEGFLITTKSSVKESSTLMALSLDNKFYANDTDFSEIIGLERLVFGAHSKWIESPLYDYSTVLQTLNATVDSRALFPYISGEDTEYKVASAIVYNAYQKLSYNTETSTEGNTGSLNDNYMLHTLVISSLSGNNNTQGYVKDQELDYDNYVNNSDSRVESSIKSWSNSIAKSLTDVDGIIGLKTSYEDPILGRMYTTVRNNVMLFVVILVLILLIAFMKLKRDLLETILLLGASVACFLAFVFIIPVYMPMFYNMIVNNMDENLTYEVLATKAEQFDASDGKIVQIDSDGQYVMNTSSLTLYKVGLGGLDGFFDSLGVEADNLTGGKSVIIDQDAGVFAEGDSIKVNTDLLFANLPITGEYKDLDGTTVYQITANKTVSSNIDYYVPYYQLVDAFVVKLNDLAKIYKIPRRTTVYADGKSKNNYLLYSYINSAPFLTPGHYDAVEQAETVNIDAYSEYLAESSALAEELKASFGTNVDWLGCSSFLWELSETSKKTLWAQSLQKNGYYDANWVPVEDKMNDLITYVNRQTKDFIFDMDDPIGKLSDSTMIKTVALRALVAFTQRSSEYGTWLYPFSLNYAELTLGDVLLSVFTDDYSKFVSMDMDTVSYVSAQHGWFNLIVFDVVVILMFIVANLIKFLVPIMYLLFGFMTILKLVLRGDVKVTLRGYVKCSLLVFGVFTIFGVSIVVAKGMRGSVVAIYLLLLVNLIILFMLFLVTSSVLLNLTDMGNEQIGVRLGSAAEHVPFNQTFKQFNVSTTNMRYARKRGSGIGKRDLGYSRLDPYSNVASVDSFYSGNVDRVGKYSGVVMDDLRESDIDDSVD